MSQLLNTYTLTTPLNNKQTLNVKELPFGLFTDGILEYCNETFSTMYRHIFQKYWHNNNLIAKMPRNYVATDWKNGRYEVYIPTRDSADMNMQYFRISISVLPRVDYETARSESEAMRNGLIAVNGKVDSELNVIIAPHLKQRGFIRGFNHAKGKKGYLTAVIVSKFPEICFKRLLVLLTKFFETRLKKLLENLGFEPYQYDYMDCKKFYYSYVQFIVERYSYLIGLTIKNFSHCLAWFDGKLKSVLHNIGLQNTLKMAMKPLKEQSLSKTDKRTLIEMFKAVIGELPTVKPMRSDFKIQVATQKEQVQAEVAKATAEFNYMDYLQDRVKRNDTPPKHNKIHMHGSVYYV